MKKYLVGFMVALAVMPLFAGAAGLPSLTVRSAPHSLQIDETGTWQIGINYPTNNIGTSSFYAVWGDESTPPTQFPYVGPNNTSGADDAAKFYHAYEKSGSYQPRFYVVNQQGQTASLSTIVNVGNGSQPSVSVTVNGSDDSLVRIPSGMDVRIAWSAEDATSCSVSDGNGYNSNGNSPESSIVVHSPVNATYTVTCSNAVKNTSKSITIVVIPSASSSSSAFTSHGKVPPAGYEDEVLTNIQTYQNPFPDTDMHQLGGRAAAELYRRAVIGGFPDGQFKGEREVNRAEAAKFLLLAEDYQVGEANHSLFPDVMDNQWYTKYVIAAAKLGIINGYPDGTFKPADQVNTAEFLKMLSLTFGLQLHMTYSYSDVSSGDWFAPYAGIAQRYNLFPCRTTALNPETPLSRQDVAVAIYQYLSQR